MKDFPVKRKPCQRPDASIFTQSFFWVRWYVSSMPTFTLFIYILAMKDLAVALHANAAIQGVWVGDLSHKLSLFADDLLLCVSNPRIAFPSILHELDQFGLYRNSKMPQIATSLYTRVKRNPWQPPFYISGNPICLNIRGFLSPYLKVKPTSPIKLH